MEEERDERSEIRKLSIFNGKNFGNWKFRMQILLKEHGIESFLTKSVNEYEEIKMLQNDEARSTSGKG